MLGDPPIQCIEIEVMDVVMTEEEVLDTEVKIKVLDMEVTIMLNFMSTKKKRWNNLKTVANVTVTIIYIQPNDKRFDKLKFTFSKVHWGSDPEACLEWELKVDK